MRNILSVKDLIARKEELESRKKCTYELETPIGTVVAIQLGRQMMIDATEMKKGEGDPYVIYNCIIEPDLKDKELQKAYNCIEPMDIVGKLFKSGEIPAVAEAIMDISGYRQKVDAVEQQLKAIKN